MHVGKVSLWSFLSSKLEDISIRIYHSLLKCFFLFYKNYSTYSSQVKTRILLPRYLSFQQLLKRALILRLFVLSFQVRQQETDPRLSTFITSVPFGENRQKWISELYEGWNFNSGNTAVTFDTAHLQSSYFHRPSMYSPKLCRTRSQR